MKPHKHEKFIKLKAEGLLIERKVSSVWVEADWCSFDWTGLEFRIAPEQTPDADGWIPWFGGENPVPGMLVDYQCITATYSNTLSERLSWGHRGSDGDITHYRIVKEKVKKWRWMYCHHNRFGIYLTEHLTEAGIAELANKFPQMALGPRQDWTKVECDE